jgi:hypothetical protein
MEELDRYLAAHEDLFEKSFSSSSLSQQQQQQRKSLPQSQSRHLFPPKPPQAVRNPSSRKNESIIRSEMKSNTSTHSHRSQQSNEKISQLSARADLMKMEFNLSIDQFMNSYLEEWKGRRKLQFRCDSETCN